MPKRGYFEAGRQLDKRAGVMIAFAGRILYNGLHWHDEDEILLCKRGTLTVEVDGVRHELAAGDCLGISRGSSHEITGSADGLQIICSIDPHVFDDRTGGKLVFSSKEAEPADLLEVNRLLSGIVYEQMQHRTGEASKSMQFSVWSMQYALLSIIAKYRRMGEEKTAKHRDLLYEGVRYINGHLGEELSAQVLADQLHVSEPTVYRLFRDQMGLHLSDYITQVRLDAVCRYLLDTDDKITGIAYACGFSGLSNFYRVFKKYMKMSPAEYRKMHQTESGRSLTMEADIMKLNRFEYFGQLGLPAEVLLDRSQIAGKDL